MKILFDWGAIAQTDPPFIYFYVEELSSSLCSNVLKNSLSFVYHFLSLSLSFPLSPSHSLTNLIYHAFPAFMMAAAAAAAAAAVERLRKETLSDFFNSKSNFYCISL